MGSDGVGCKVLTGITGEPHCFVAGTMVSTEEGQRAIEEVEAGDKVWAYDEETGEKGLKEVEEVFVSETDKLVHVETDREEIVTTELHPFYVEGIGFVQAGRLEEGYELKCLDGGKETIAGIRVEWLEEAITVYNFEVADYHTYYVGDGDVLVHNKCANPSGDDGANNSNVSRKGAFRAAKRDAGVPVSQQPYNIVYTPMRSADYEGSHVIKDLNDNVIITREYYFKNNNGDTIIIQDHSAGHEKGGQGSHFNVRPDGRTRKGKVPGTQGHYLFEM